MCVMIRLFILYKTIILFSVKVLLQYINTRWLSLLRSIERLLENFEPVKLYFMNQPTSTNTQKFIQSFFGTDEGLCVLNFLQNVLSDVQRAELQLQRSYTTIVDLHFIITNLINKLHQKLFDKYYGNNTRLLMKQLKNIDETKSEEFIQAFESFINSVIDYIKSYFNVDSEFYEKLSFFNIQSIHFLTWENIVDVADALYIDDLDRDQLYSEFCDIKCLYETLKKKNINLSEQIKSYISSKTNDFSMSMKINHQSVLCESDDDTETISLSNKQDDDSIRSDQLWAYLLNVNPSPTPNMKKIISYIFSIPCSNSYVETIFSHMKHLWSDYRNRMDIELVSAELKIRMNGNYSCEQFYKHVLAETQLLKQIRKNGKYE